MEKEAVKIRTDLLNALRELKKKDGRSLSWHLDKASENYLRAKKVLK